MMAHRLDTTWKQSDQRGQVPKLDISEHDYFLIITPQWEIPVCISAPHIQAGHESSATSSLRSMFNKVVKKHHFFNITPPCLLFPQCGFLQLWSHMLYYPVCILDDCRKGSQSKELTSSSVVHWHMGATRTYCAKRISNFATGTVALLILNCDFFVGL